MVADYIFEKDKIFAYINLSDEELNLYNRYYNMFREKMPTPDLGDLSAGFSRSVEADE